MNILIVTQYFWPENFKINDLAQEMVSRGHDVTVLTGIPNYPSGKFFKGYGLLKKRVEKYNGIKIIRSPIIARGTGSGFRLAVNYLSFVIGCIFSSIKLLNKSFDSIFVFEVSPITVCLPAIFFKKIKKTPICLWVLDLWPESINAASKINSKNLSKLLTPLIKYIYNNTDKILVSSRGFIKSINDKGIAKKKIEYFPQWAEEVYQPIEKKTYQNFPKLNKDSFKIIFAGNIGESQDFPSILKAASILKNEKIDWIFIGNGRKKKWVEKEIKKYNLNNSVHMLGSFPINKMPLFFSNADCLLFSLKKKEIFSLTVPGKVQSYLASGKPILAMIDGEAAKIIKDAKAGATCNSEDSKSLAKNVKRLMSLSKKDLDKLGQNGYMYYKKHFDRIVLMDRIEFIFKNLKLIP